MNVELVNENFQSDYVRNLLRARGIKSIDSFLSPSERLLEDPSRLDNISEGADLLINTIKKPNSKIVTIVDCDTDGYCSCAIIYQYIKLISPSTDITVLFHNGKQHGFSDKINEILDSDTQYDLCVITDAGSNDFKYTEELKEINLPVLVIDHHILENEVSDNVVLINNQASANYENKALCGGGMVYQFCKYIDAIYGYNYADQFIDLAALAEIGDMMDTRELENRYIIKTGLNNIRNQFFLDIIDKQAYSMQDKVNPTTIAFYVAPLINAMIRVGTQAEKEQMFWAFIDGRKEVPSQKRGAKGTMEFISIESIRECTNARNRQNRLLDQITEKIEAKIYENGLLDNQILFIRLEDEDSFPAELNGLVAMRLCAKYKKPTIVARLNEEGIIRGSARGVNQCKLTSFKDFLASTNLFEYTMGHDNAFGISIHNSSLTKLHNIANNELASIDFGDSYFGVNFERNAASLDLQDLVFELGNYEDIWGQGNPAPFIYVSDINITPSDIQIMGKNSDTLKIEKFGISYMKFHAKDLINELKQFNEIKLNIVGRPNLNEWQGNVTPQIFIEDYEILDNTYGF